MNYNGLEESGAGRRSFACVGCGKIASTEVSDKLYTRKSRNGKWRVRHGLIAASQEKHLRAKKQEWEMARKGMSIRRGTRQAITREKAGMWNWRVRQETSAPAQGKHLRARKQECGNGA